MNLSEASPNKLYSAQLTKPFLFHSKQYIHISVSEEKPITVIILVVSNISNSYYHRFITYEILAASADIIQASLPTDLPIQEFNPADLPLYIHYPLKSPNFEQFLKDLPPIENKTLQASAFFKDN